MPAKIVHKSNWDKLTILILNNKALIILFVMVIVAQFVSKGIFFTYNNISSVMRQVSVSIILGIGFTVVLASGGVDLSVGHMVSLLGVVYASASLVIPLPLAIITTMAVGCILGSCNGLISQTFKLPPFIVTLATAQIYRGIASLATDGKSITGLSNEVKFIGQGLIIFDKVPMSLVVAIVISIIVAVVIYRTKFGRHIVATGGNAEAASVSGINTKAIKVSAYMIMSVCVALGSIVLTGRIGSAMPAAGTGMEMDAIAAVVIGGTPMSGGKARVIGTVIGCFIMGIISNSLNLAGVSSFWQWIAKGIIIIAAIFMDSQTEAFFSNRRRKIVS